MWSFHLAGWLLTVSLLQTGRCQEVGEASYRNLAIGVVDNGDVSDSVAAVVAAPDDLNEYIRQVALANNVDDEDIDDSGGWIMLPVHWVDDNIISGTEKRFAINRQRGTTKYRRFPKFVGKRNRLLIGKQSRFNLMHQYTHPYLFSAPFSPVHTMSHFVGKRSTDRSYDAGKRRMFVGKREDYVDDSINDATNEEKRRMFVGKRLQDVLQELAQNNKRRMFVGKRAQDDSVEDNEGKRRMFVGRRSDDTKRRMFVGKRDYDADDVNDQEKRRRFVGKRTSDDEFSKRRMFVGKRNDEADEEMTKRRMFVGKRQDESKRRMFVGKRDDEYDEDNEKRRMFVGKRSDEFEDDYEKRRMFVGKRNDKSYEDNIKRRMFVGKRSHELEADLDKRRMFVGKRDDQNEDAKRRMFVGKRRMFVGKKSNDGIDISDIYSQQMSGKRRMFVGKRSDDLTDNSSAKTR